MYSKKGMVEMVLFFYAWSSYKAADWNGDELLEQFRADGYCIKKSQTVAELTESGEEFLHRFIVEETMFVVSELLKSGKEHRLSQIINTFDYGDETDAFLEYLFKNDSQKEESFVKSYVKSYHNGICDFNIELK